MSTRKRAERKMKRFWLSYDLGLRGDYSGLYQWLDGKDAKECGDSIATFLSDRTQEEIEGQIKETVGDDAPRARVYLIAPAGDGKFNGKFLIGRRKSSPPWAGFLETAVDTALDQ
ncbi:MAG TPA: hypothetical protein VFC39_06880 [Acidobacteriaceae bacterium]|nr:hypothetical protein [Acidobacteriaceae bacterium]